MTEKSLHGKKEEKYFFTANIFDEGEPEEQLPVVPTFTEQDLEAARKDAFQEGRKAAMLEAETIRGKQITAAVQKISQDMTTLFAAEHAREKTYEQEVTALALQIFNKLFPLYKRQYGFAELKDAMNSILEKQKGQKQIVIFVSPDDVEAIRSHLAPAMSAETGPTFTVKSDESLSSGACRMAWSGGGAVRDPHALAEEIKSILEQTLAGNAAKGHDSAEPDLTRETSDG